MKNRIYHIVVPCCLALLSSWVTANDALKRTEALVDITNQTDEVDEVTVDGIDVVNEISDAPTEVSEKSAARTKKSKTGALERAVMPVTRWIEDKIHNVYKAESSTSPTEASSGPAIGLREAINLAREKHGGTVLSADRIDDEGDITYRVKILLGEGIIKMVDVNGKPQALEGQE